LDERVADDAARRLEERFHHAGHSAGARFMSELDAAMNTNDLDRAVSALGTRVGHGLGTAMTAAFAGSAALVGTLAGIGDQFEQINRGIMSTTDVSGAALEGLKSSAIDVAGSVSTSLKTLGNDMGILASRLGLIGEAAQPALKQLTGQIEELHERFGKFNADAFAGAMVEFGVAGRDAVNVLASLVESSRHFGADLGTVTTSVAQFGSILTELGLNAEQSGRMIAELTAQHVPLSQAIAGLESAEKAAAKAGQPLPEFLDRLSKSAEYYVSIGRQDLANELSLGVAGQRRWAQAKQAFEDFLKVRRAGPDAFGASPESTDSYIKQTETLKDRFVQLRNQIESALAPVALNVVDDLSHKFDNFIAWLNSHQEDFRRFFETGAGVAMSLLTTLGDLAALLGRHPQLIGAVVAAFAAWKGITAIAEMVTAIRTISTLLGTQIPKAAAEAAAANVVAANTSADAWAKAGTATGAFLGTILKIAAVVEALKFIGGTDLGKKLGLGEPEPSAQDQDWHWGPIPFKDPYGWEKKLPGMRPPKNAETPGTATHTPPPGSTGSFYGDWYRQQGFGPPSTPSAPPPPPSPPGVPPPDLLTPEALASGGAGGKGKAPKAPEAPEVPYGPSYTAPPLPGETSQHFSARGGLLEAQHKVEEDRARLNQLESSNNATQDQIQKIRNKLVEDQRAEYEARMRLAEQEKQATTAGTRQLKETGDALQQVGAQLDQDFGISKGLPGIAENLTKFLANLAAAPVIGALSGVSAAIGGPTHGAGGLIGAAALGGAFGPQYTPAALGAAAGGGQGGGAGQGSAGVGSGGVGSFSTPSSYPGSVSSPAELQAAGGRVGALYQFAEALQGTPYSQALRNDCSGMVSQLASVALGLPPPAAGQRFNTTNEGQWLTQHGFQMGSPPPGVQAFSVGWNPAPGNAGHTAATLPGGVHAEQGGSNSSFTLGPKAAGGESSQFPMHAYLPMGIPSFDSGGAVPAVLHEGEHVLTKSDVSALGGQAGVYAMRAALPHFDGGGSVGTPQIGPFPVPDSVAKQAPFGISGGGLLGVPFGDSGKGLLGNAFGESGKGLLGAVHFDGGGEVSPFVPPSIPSGASVSKPTSLGGLLGVGAPQGPKQPTPLPPPVLKAMTDTPQVGPFPVPPGVKGKADEIQKARGPAGPADKKPPGQAGPAEAGPPIKVPKLPGEVGPPPPPAPPGGPEPGPTLKGGAAPPQGYGEGFKIEGGLIGVLESLPATALQAAGAAGGAMGGPGGSAGGSAASSAISALMNIGIQELNRGIGALAQGAGAIGSGILQTWLPTGASDLATQSWLTRFASGIIGAKPQLPNVAGPKQGPAGLTPEQAAQAGGGGAAHGVGGAPGPGGARDSSAPLINIQGGYHNHAGVDAGAKALTDQAIVMSGTIGAR
jgi:hypothetical protein